MRRFALALVASVLVLVGFAAQERTAPGVIAGQVLDVSATPVPHANVVLRGGRTPERSAMTSATGRFRFDGVPVGTYVLEITHAEFETQTRPVTIAADAEEGLALSLTLARRPTGSAQQAPRAAESLGESARIAAELDAVREARVEAAPMQPSGVVSGVPGGVIGGVVGGLPAGTPPPPSAAPGSVSHPAESWRHPDPRRFNTEAYSYIEDNPFRATGVDPLSTFSIDVDTASYSNIRRFLNDGLLPPPDAVRIEEMINYFRFDYPSPSGGVPFSVTTEVAAAPWTPRHRLALIGLQARQLDVETSLRRNLVFLIDVSGSMQPANKLPLIRKAMRMLVNTLTPRDRIAVVVYAGASGLALPSTSGAHKERIHHAIERLQAGGSTNGAGGITLAYRVAQEGFIAGGVNRVILATDGDFNVGVTNEGDLVRLIEEKRRAGVFLSVLGVGTGNLKDATMEKLADKGNGNYSYLDSLHEARKVLVSEAGATLVTVAKDVKIQVEFNPAHVAAYRLIGYENRLLRHEDFNDDMKDAGEIGAGHTVTALYEIVPPGVPLQVPGVDPLKYQPAPSSSPSRSPALSNELMTVKLRYKDPAGDESRLLEFAVPNREVGRPENLGFASAVAEFGMLLRHSEHRGSASYRDAAALARQHRGADDGGYRAEFIRLIELAEVLARESRRDTTRH
jgi:Ca-activated chloride channel family protein